MADYQILIGALTLLIGIISYSFYFRDFLKGSTKPDASSWFIWGLLAAMSFFAQFSKDGGAGAWITALTSVACFAISATAFYRGYRHIKLLDWVSLAGVAVGIWLWINTNDPLLAVIFALCIGALGFIPVFVKVFNRPKEETALTYGLNASKFAVALFALHSFTPTTWLYPAGMAAMNAILVTVIVFRTMSTKS